MTSNYYEDDDQEFDVNEFLDQEYKTNRKRRPKQPQVYFTKDTEEAILQYLKETDTLIRNKIYNERISYAFYKLAENIIHTFKFYYTDTDTIEELKYEVVAFLLEKLHLYDQNKGKAYSYFGTIAKRYLINYNAKNYQKLQDKVDISEIDEENGMFVETTKHFSENSLGEFIDQYLKYMDKHLFDVFPKPKDAQIADSILELFRRRESLDIFNKKALYIYIREMTNVETPQITKIIKKLKILYTQLYNEFYLNGFLKI